jgi:hypothetical protein
MDLYKAISSTGEILYEFTSSLILIPRTMAKVLRNPTWAVDYLNSQTSEKPKARFEKYSNPILFWIVLGILPYYFLINTYFQGFTDGVILDAYNGIGVANIVGGLSIFLVSFPVSCAFVLHLFKYKGFTKTAFKKSFYTQLYLTAPVQLFYIPLLFTNQLPDLWLIILGSLGIGLVIWFLIAELIVIKKELNYRWITCLGVLISMYIMFYIFAAICFVIFFLVNMGHFQKLSDAVFGGLDPTPQK